MPSHRLGAPVVFLTAVHCRPMKQNDRSKEQDWPTKPLRRSDSLLSHCPLVARDERRVAVRVADLTHRKVGLWLIRNGCLINTSAFLLGKKVGDPRGQQIGIHDGQLDSQKYENKAECHCGSSSHQHAVITQRFVRSRQPVKPPLKPRLASHQPLEFHFSFGLDSTFTIDIDPAGL